MPFPEHPSSDFAYRDRLQQTARIIAAERLTVRAAEALRSTDGTFEAGGDVTIQAGADVEVVGGAVTGGGDVTVEAGGTVRIASVQEREEYEFALAISSGGLFGTDVDSEARRTQTGVKRSEVTAGGT